MNRPSKRQWIIGGSSAVVLVLLIGLMSYYRPGVPREVSILTGPEGSQSHRWAEQYATYVGQHGIVAKVVATAGSGEILRRLLQDRTTHTVGFLQSGVEQELGMDEASQGLVSLGSLYFEPCWLFATNASAIERIPDLVGRRVALGQVGSDSRAIARRLLSDFGVSDRALTAVHDELGPSEAADALLAGRIDAAFFAGDLGAPSISRLLAADKVHPVSVQHAEVYQRRQPDVGELLIPKGLFDLARMIPRKDIRVIAPAMNFVGPESLHPALVDLFLDAATSIQGRPSLLAPRGTFPSEDYTSLPMNPDATRYYKNGPSGLRKYLPFWLATWINRLMVLVVPVLVVVSGVLKGIPIVVGMRLSRNLSRLYKRLRRIEDAADTEDRGDELVQELDAIDEESKRLHIPYGHLAQYFELRQTIHDTRSRLTGS